jgi:hypothetical protein
MTPVAGEQCPAIGPCLLLSSPSHSPLPSISPRHWRWSASHRVCYVRMQALRVGWDARCGGRGMGCDAGARGSGMRCGRRCRSSVGMSPTAGYPDASPKIGSNLAPATTFSYSPDR